MNRTHIGTDLGTAAAYYCIVDTDEAGSWKLVSEQRVDESRPPVDVGPPKVRPKVRKVDCAHCGMDAVSEQAAYQIVVYRRANGWVPPMVRCKSCDKMNLLELVDGNVAATAIEAP